MSPRIPGKFKKDSSRFVFTTREGFSGVAGTRLALLYQATFRLRLLSR